ncbi:MAG: hypothetical protein MUF84_18870 [Anaerolineae bacterium]|nr:hypothetical protein [Anaerolineae bacterium]
MANDRPEAYLSYLLRLWTSGGDERPTWRASLEDPLTGVRKGFADPDALFTFLRERMGLGGERPEQQGGDAESQPM